MRRDSQAYQEVRELVVDEKRQSGERHFKASLYISGSKMRRTRYFQMHLESLDLSAPSALRRT